jgi:hypothetical protein
MVGTKPRRRRVRHASVGGRGRYHRPLRPGGGQPVIARERGPGYTPAASGPDDVGSGSGPSEVDPAGGALTSEDALVVRDASAVVEAAERLASADLDALSDAALRGLLGVVQHAANRLGTVRTRGTGLLEARALRAAGPGRENQALRVTRQQLAEDLQLSPSEVKRAGETGRRLAESPASAAALRDGKLPADHARVLAETLKSLSGSDREHAERVLLDAARTEDLQRFGRTCRRVLCELDAAAAQRAQERRNARRELRVTQTPDGMTAVHGQGSGWDAEVVQTALHAFRRPDAAGESRRSEQRSWDALVSVCQAALDAGTASANRNVRPHVLVTIDHASLVSDAGVVDTAWSGPVPWSEVRRHLADVGVSRLLTDPSGLPVEAGEAVRTVPAGLWKLLQVRDRVCIGRGCDVPAAWCQVMHLEVPFRFQGQLTPRTAAPGCSFHHRMLDHHGWQVTWVEDRPVLHHPHRPPPRPDDPGPPSPDPKDPGPRPPGPDGSGSASPGPDDPGPPPPGPDGSGPPSRGPDHRDLGPSEPGEPRPPTSDPPAAGSPAPRAGDRPVRREQLPSSRDGPPTVEPNAAACQQQEELFPDGSDAP